MMLLGIWAVSTCVLALSFVLFVLVQAAARVLPQRRSGLARGAQLTRIAQPATTG